MGSTGFERDFRPRDVLAEDILRLPTLFVNTYVVGTAEHWILVDTGLPGFAGSLRGAVEHRFGRQTRPAAILLTHGHWDHAGSALELANAWDVPIFAHEMELPYLTGKSDYAPKDVTVGGMIAFMARFFPTHGYDFGDRVRPLPAGGAVPEMPEWHWIYTPGHTHGHISLFRERDSVLLAGDALATVNQDNPKTMITRKPEFYRPPAPFTVDWDAAASSIQELAALAPRAVGAGHGWPILGTGTAERLGHFARTFRKPEHGRYSEFPATADMNGIVAVPPAVPDRNARRMAVWGVAGLGGIAALLIAQDWKRRRNERIHTG